MKNIFIFSIWFMMSFNTSVKAQFLEEDQVALVCPEGLIAAGFSRYYKPFRAYPDGILMPQDFSICVNCKPEKEEPYQWIEICFANNDDPLRGNFYWETKSCKDRPSDDSNKILLGICQDEKLVCGLTIATGRPTLKLAINGVQSIPCTKGMTDPAAFTDNQPESVGYGILNPTVVTETKSNIVNYDVDLACPINSTLLGLERFKLPASDGSIPVL